MEKRVRNNRDQKHPLSRIPPEKKKELNYMLHDKEVISVFTDCSSMPNQDKYILGLGVSFIGYSDIKVRSRKIASEQQTATIYGELKAVTFAIQCLPQVLERYRTLMIKPRKVIIYTDCDHIQKIHDLLHSSNDIMKEAMEEVIITKNNFNQTNSSYMLELKYLGDHKKHHLYHRMAHSAARKILLK